MAFVVRRYERLPSYFLGWWFQIADCIIVMPNRMQGKMYADSPFNRTRPLIGRALRRRPWFRGGLSLMLVRTRAGSAAKECSRECGALLQIPRLACRKQEHRALRETRTLTDATKGPPEFRRPLFV